MIPLDVVSGGFDMVCNGRRVVIFNEGLGLLGSIHWSENGWPFRVWSGNGYRFSGQVWKMGILESIFCLAPKMVGNIHILV